MAAKKRTEPLKLIPLDELKKVVGELIHAPREQIEKDRAQPPSRKGQRKQ